ncbi:hypothetical protein ABT369_28270 [Dactylosporangium sp. NPDC000244]|uniref:hypothetical protein n=1 Tax=Dactylosporangium sp. NPDC000244 TaxID=3154365 RepID=UPI003320D05F
MSIVKTPLRVYASQHDRDIRLDRWRGTAEDWATLISAPNCRGKVSIVVDGVPEIEVTVEAMTDAFDSVSVDPFGFATMRVAHGWFAVDVDAGPASSLLLQLSADEVAAFLADVALEACKEIVSAGGCA